MRLKFRPALGIALALFCVSASANTQVFLASAPKPKEIVSPPRGYAYCRMVPSGFENGVWTEQHRVCDYHGTHRNGTWVSGHWICQKFKPHKRICKSWAWVPSAWIGKSSSPYHSPRTVEYETGIEPAHNVAQPAPQPVAIGHD